MDKGRPHLRLVKNSRNLITPEKVRSQLIAAHVSICNALDRGAHLGRELVDFVKPTPDVGLRDGLADFLGQAPGELPLPVDEIDCPAKGLTVDAAVGAPIDSHAAESDKYTCLMQQIILSIRDRTASSGYSSTMKSDLDTLAKRLKWAMDQAHMDDKAVALEVGRIANKKVAWQTIQSIRSGAAKTSGYVPHIAAALNCDAIWLGSGKGEPYAAKTLLVPSLYADLTAEALAFARRWQALKPHLRNRISDALLAYEALAQQEAEAEERPTPTHRRDRA